MTTDLDLKLVGDDELLAALRGLDYKTQHKQLKRILRDTSQKTVVKRLRQNSPKSSRLKKSFGTVTGKSRSVATVFAGPRIPTQGGAKTTTNQGYLANIIEFNKFQLRYPGVTRWGQPRKRPRLPDGSVRRHSGVFRWRPFIRRTLLLSLHEASNYQAKAIRNLITKEWNKHKRLTA